MVTGRPDYRGRHRVEGWTDTGVLDASDVQAARDAAAPAGLSSYVVSHLRTLVPILWGAIVTWGIERWVPWMPAAVATDPMVLTILTSAVTAGWYALWRAAEPMVPKLLVTVLLGHSAEPAYAP